MFWHIAWFEIRFWLKSWMVWIFLFIIATLWMFATSSDRVVVGDAIGNTFRNAPFVIQSFYATIGLFTLLMSTAFVNATAIRDFKYNTNQILFSSPLRRRDFLLGRFAGATLISVIPMLGVSIGMLLARYMPWADPERFSWRQFSSRLPFWHAMKYCLLWRRLLCSLLMASLGR
jgi:ABC-type transport system involved in multi-copper enzyme maturation permease subunit